MVGMDHRAQTHDQPGEQCESAGREDPDRDRDVDREGDHHAHPVPPQESLASAVVEAGLHVDVEEPLRPSQHRLTSATDTAVDANRPEQRVEHDHRADRVNII